VAELAGHTGWVKRQLRSLHAAGESVADLGRSFKISRATTYPAIGAAAKANA